MRQDGDTYGVDTKYDLSYNARRITKPNCEDEGVEIVPARMWLAAAVVVALLAAAVAWNARSSQLGGPVSALEVESVTEEPALGPQPSDYPAASREAPTKEAVPAGTSAVEPAVAPGESASKAPEPPASDASPASATKQAAQDQDLRGGLHIGGHSRLMDSFIGVVDVDESDVAKTINVHILRDEDYRYYFDLDSQTVPAGEKVMFVVDNTHFTPDECW